MIERLIVASLIIGIGFALYRFGTRAQMRRTSAFIAYDPLLSSLKPGIPAVVYFTTPTCAPCRFQQMPALEQLQRALGNGVQIIRIDATEQPHDADRWGVISVPTTFIVDKRGQTRAVNHGVADARKLQTQIASAAI